MRRQRTAIISPKEQLDYLPPTDPNRYIAVQLRLGISDRQRRPLKTLTYVDFRRNEYILPNQYEIDRLRAQLGSRPIDLKQIDVLRWYISVNSLFRHDYVRNGAAIPLPTYRSLIETIDPKLGQHIHRLNLLHLFRDSGSVHRPNTDHLQPTADNGDALISVADVLVRTLLPNVSIVIPPRDKFRYLAIAGWDMQLTPSPGRNEEDEGMGYDPENDAPQDDTPF